MVVLELLSKHGQTPFDKGQTSANLFRVKIHMPVQKFEAVHEKGILKK